MSTVFDPEHSDDDEGRWGTVSDAAQAFGVSVEWMALAEIVTDERVQPWTKESLQRAEKLRKMLNW